MKSIILPLLVSLHMVESSNGLTSKNRLQIRDICVEDVNRIYGTSYTMRDAYNIIKSEEIALLYLYYWGRQYFKKTGKEPTHEVFARMWNGGPNGWKKYSTLKYWNKVKKELNKTK